MTLEVTLGIFNVMPALAGIHDLLFKSRRLNESQPRLIGISFPRRFFHYSDPVRTPCRPFTSAS